MTLAAGKRPERNVFHGVWLASAVRCGNAGRKHHEQGMVRVALTGILETLVRPIGLDPRRLRCRRENRRCRLTTF